MVEPEKSREVWGWGGQGWMLGRKGRSGHAPISRSGACVDRGTFSETGSLDEEKNF